MNTFDRLAQFHGQHNQKDHGNWADGLGDVDGGASKGGNSPLSNASNPEKAKAIQDARGKVEVPGEEPRHPLYPDVPINSAGRINRFNKVGKVFSNFEPVKVRLPDDDRVYPTVENAFQAAKRPVEDRDEFVKATPGMAKSLGGRRHTVLPADWNERAPGIMEDLLRQKFSKPQFKKALLATGDWELIEGPTMTRDKGTGWRLDPVWGDAPDGSGVGQNKLGKALMKIREELRRK